MTLHKATLLTVQPDRQVGYMLLSSSSKHAGNGLSSFMYQSDHRIPKTLTQALNTSPMVSP